MPDNGEGGDGARNGGAQVTVGPSYNLGEKEKLAGVSNYQALRFILKGILTSENLVRCIGETAIADVDLNNRAFFKIVMNVKTNLHPILWALEGKPKQAWDKLETLYGDKNITNRMGLYRQLFSVRQNQFATVEEYLNEIVHLQQKLVSMNKGLDDEVIAYIMLLGLGEEYQSLQMAIESTSTVTTDLSSDSVRSKILSCKMFTASSEAEAAMYSKGNPRKIACFFCGGNHYRHQCNKYKKHLEQQKQQGLSAGGSTDGAGKSSSGGKPKYKPKSKGKAFATQDDDDSASGEECLLAIDNDDLCNVQSALKVMSMSDKEVDWDDHGTESAATWIVDSGATKHMCNDRELFDSIKPVSQSVTVANDARLSCTGVGQIKFHQEDSSLNAKGVMLVPKLSANLLSVPSMVDKDLRVLFVRDKCLVYNNSGKILFKAPRSGNLFVVEQKQRGDSTNPEAALAVSSEQELWHRRLGHLGATQMRQLQHEKNLSPNTAIHPHSCEVCHQGKMKRAPFPSGESQRAEGVLDLIHADLVGKMRVPSVGGSVFALIIVDDHSRKIFFYPLKSKSQAYEKFVEFKALVEKQTGRKIKRVRTDNGKEFVNKRFQKLFLDHGIKHERSCDYTPQQNGTAERANGSVLSVARCLLFQAGLDKKFWAEAMNCAVYLRNRCPSRALDGLIPEEVWTGMPVNYEHLRVFGSTAHVMIPKEKRGKFDPRSRKLTFIGYSEMSKGYKFVDLKEPTMIIRSRDAHFEEDHICSTNLDIDFQPEEPSVIETPAVTVQIQNAVKVPQIPEPRVVVIEDFEPDSFNSSFNFSDSEGFQGFEDQLEEEHRYPQRIRRKKQNLDMVYSFLTVLNKAPLTMKEAVNSPDADQWKRAMEEEISCLRKNNAWELVSRPTNQKVVSSKWLFKIKRDADGNPVRYKARFVARGFSQTPGVDYQDTFSPTVSHASVRLLFALAAKMDWITEHLDVETAFLQGELQEELYIEPPQGFVEGSKVCKLNKAIYGLKQAAYAWYHTIRQALAEMNFKASLLEPCIFYKHSEEDKIVVTLYVDDLILFSSNRSLVNSTKNELRRRFTIRELGPVRDYLGVRINRTPDGSIHLDQQAYLDQVLERFGMTDCNGARTPMENHTIDDDPDAPGSTKPYQNLIGSLMYLAVFTRPDIMHAVSALSQFNNCAKEMHWVAAKRVLKYLKMTSHLKLTYTKHGSDLTAFSDANWGTCPIDRKSYTGFVILFADAAICWESRKQRCVALSSTDAEFVALSECVRTTRFIAQLMQEILLCQLPPVPTYCDNRNAVLLAKEQGPSKKLRQIDIRYHFVKENVENHLVELQHLPFTEMIADILTTPLPFSTFEKCLHRFGLKP